MQDGLRKVKNDPDLQSSATNAGNYVVLNGITAVGSPESGDAPPRLRGVNLAGDDGPDLRQHEIRQPAHGRLVADRCAFVEPAFTPRLFPAGQKKSGKKVAAASNKLAISPRYTKNRLLRQGKDLPC